MDRQAVDFLFWLLGFKPPNLSISLLQPLNACRRERRGSGHLVVAGGKLTDWFLCMLPLLSRRLQLTRQMPGVPMDSPRLGAHLLWVTGVRLLLHSFHPESHHCPLSADGVELLQALEGSRQYCWDTPRCLLESWLCLSAHS